MNENPPDTIDVQSEHLVKINRKIDSICDAFEDEWTVDEPADILEFSQQIDESHRTQLVEQLIQIDIELRIKSGQVVDGDVYGSLGDEAKQFARKELMMHQTVAPTTTLNMNQQTSRRIGPYELLQQIGEGGMGSVWLAEQIKPVRRRVALKLIKRGMADKQVVARFEAERQALTMMDHQCIARVLDAGETDDGNPYFVMELVDGIPITEYCDKHHLSVTQRLKLVVNVCKAIQHAHQKGIIHRDLKPANILVAEYEGEPVPKVIDFGLAKALEQKTKLTDKTVFTEFGQVLGTVQYMAPEQAAMDPLDIDTRTDVYALGVVLYELLTGSPPLDRETMGERSLLDVLELVREKEPIRPSDRLDTTRSDSKTEIVKLGKISLLRLHSLLRGELDWIIMKALEKDRARRYQSANGFSDDLERFLNSEPVEARPPSRIYRLNKFVQKNQGLFASLATVFVLLITGIAATTWLAVQANTARARAESESNRADKEADRAGEEAIRAKTSETLAINAKEETEHALADSRYVVANVRQKAGRVHEALTLLDSIPEKYRNVEWYLSRQSMAGSDLTLFGHRGPVDAVAGSPNGDWIASVAPNDSIRVWDSVNGSLIKSFEADDGGSCSIAFSPNANVFAAAVSSKIRVWETSTWTEIAKYENASPISAIGFSFDGSRIFWSGTDVASWNYSQPNSIQRAFQNHNPNSTPPETDGPFSPFLETSSDGKELYLSDNTTIYEIETDSLKLKRKLVIDNNRDSPFPFSVNPNRNDFAHIEQSGVYGARSRIRIVDFTGQERSSIESENTASPNTFIKYSPDGSRLCSVQGNQITIWNLQTISSFDLIGHTDQVSSVSFSADGSRLYSGSRDGTVKVWDAKTGKQHLSLQGHSARVTSLQISSDGSRVMSFCENGDAISWDFEGREIDRKTRFSPDAHVRLLNDGLHFAVFDPTRNDISIREIATGEIAESNLEIEDGMTAIPSPKGDVAIIYQSEFEFCSSDANFPRLVHMKTKKEIQFHWNLLELTQLVRENSDEPITDEEWEEGVSIYCSIGQVLFSPNGNWLLIRFTDDSSGVDVTSIWNTSTGELVLHFVDCWFDRAEFSGDSKYFALASQDQIEILSTSGWHNHNLSKQLPSKQIKYVGSQVLGGFGGGLASVNDICFHPHEPRLAISNTSEIKLWDLESGDEVTSFPTQVSVNDIEWSPDGLSLVGAFDDGTLKIWNASPQNQAIRFAGHTEKIESFGFDANRKIVYSESINGKRIAWDMETQRPIPDDFTWPETALDPLGFDSQWGLFASGNELVLVDQTYTRRDDVRHYLNAKSKIDKIWHADMADDAESRQDWHAAVFHRAGLLKTDLNEGLAWDLLQDAFERYQELDKEATDKLPGYIVNLLNTPRGKKTTSVYLSRRCRRTLWEILLKRDFSRSSIRQRYDVAVLEASSQSSPDSKRLLALLYYRLGHYQKAIETANSVEKNGEGKPANPFELEILELSHRALGNEDESEQYKSQLAQMFKSAKFEAEADSQSTDPMRIDTEFHGVDKFVPDVLTISKASRTGNFGLPATSWPERVPRQSIVNSGGGGFF